MRGLRASRLTRIASIYVAIYTVPKHRTHAYTAWRYKWFSHARVEKYVFRLKTRHSWSTNNIADFDN